MKEKKKILELLDAFEPMTSRDRRTKERFRAFVMTRANVLDRTNLEGHLTASALVMSPERRRFLLVWHKKLDKWIQPGGHADGDPDLLAVASREVQEETGLCPKPWDGKIFDLDIHAIPAAPKVPAHFHYDVRFLFVGDPDEPLRAQAEECHDVAWMSQEEIRERGIDLDPSVERMVERAYEARSVARRQESAK